MPIETLGQFPVMFLPVGQSVVAAVDGRQVLVVATASTTAPASPTPASGGPRIPVLTPIEGGFVNAIREARQLVLEPSGYATCTTAPSLAIRAEQEAWDSDLLFIRPPTE